MSGDLTTGLAAAVAAAALYGAMPVVEAGVARTFPQAHGIGLGLLWQLIRRPLWLLALVGEIGGFLAEAYAFSVAPTTLVAPVASCDMLVFVVTASVVFRRRPTPVGVLGVVSTVAGVAALALASEHAGPGRPAPTAVLLGLVVGCPIAVGVLAAVGQAALSARATERRPGVAAASVAFSAGAGIAYGIATLATRQIGRTFRADDVWQLLRGPAPYLLVISSILGLALLQRALQAATVLTFPVVSGLSAFLPVVLGIGLLGDPVPRGGRQVLLIVSLVLIAAGLVLLSRDRSSAQDGSS